MLKVNFYDDVEDHLFKYAVIISRHQGKWVFCKHKERSTYECPGGHREPGENIHDTAKRELWEETGAIQFDIKPICVYSVVREASETFGMLYYAEIYEFEQLPNLEIEKIEFFEELSVEWTYPLIQPYLLKRVQESISQS
ncbi:MAG: NUDIX domain-containing protein [Niameybacter sp.]|uniref:NUDIX hydrolase n=1 Tax=Niameybacter sp. TaxID=2033640 RepID=UPI002FC66DD0